MFELLNILPTTRDKIDGAVARNRFDTDTGKSTIYLTRTVCEDANYIPYLIKVLCHEAMHAILCTEVDLNTAYKLDDIDQGFMTYIGNVSFVSGG